MNDLDYIQPPAVAQEILAHTEALNFPMVSEPRTGALLRALAASKPAGCFLELGTGTGMGTAWLLAGMDCDSTLTSVDTNAEWQSAAEEMLGHDKRLTLVLEDGAEFLRRQPKLSYDLVFADAMPGKYEALDEALTVVRPGGFYIIDDMLPQPNWPDGHAEKVPVLLKRLLNDARFEIVPLSWASGVVVLVRKAQPSINNGR